MPKTETEEGEGEKPKPKTKTVVVMVDVDQQEKTMAVNPRNIEAIEGKSFYLINKYAQKAYREDFLDYISRLYPTFFEDNNEWDEINKSV